MELESLIPKDKFDVDNIEQLSQFSFEELEPIIPSLLEWLQDGNWPVSHPISIFLITLPASKLDPYLMEIMNGKDYEWKYFLIQMMGNAQEYQNSSSFHKEIVRISMDPTQIEIACEVHYMAKLVLE